jgi:hypothetical protein
VQVEHSAYLRELGLNTRDYRGIASGAFVMACDDDPDCNELPECSYRDVSGNTLHVPISGPALRAMWAAFDAHSLTAEGTLFIGSPRASPFFSSLPFAASNTHITLPPFPPIPDLGCGNGLAVIALPTVLYAEHCNRITNCTTAPLYHCHHHDFHPDRCFQRWVSMCALGDERD